MSLVHLFHSYLYSKSLKKGFLGHVGVQNQMDHYFEVDKLIGDGLISDEELKEADETIRSKKESLKFIKPDIQPVKYSLLKEEIEELEAVRKEMAGTSKAVDSYVRSVFNEAKDGNPYYIALAQSRELRDRMRINKLNVSKIDYIFSA